MVYDENDAESNVGVFSRSLFLYSSPAVSGAAGYGAKKAIQAATRKKKVGKISAAQMAANRRRVQQMLGRTGWGGFETLKRL